MESHRQGLENGGAVQPRPAFGLRPWFAFLRRARSLRRFAFAMAGRVLRPPRYRGVGAVAVVAGDWVFEPVTVATSFRQRLAGIHAPDTSAVLLRAASVHGRGLTEPLLVLHLSREGTAVGHDELAVGGTVRARAHWILELPAQTQLPPDGARIRVLPSSPE